MAATNYLTDDYVCALLGDAIVRALFDIGSGDDIGANTSFLETCYSASATIAIALGKAGYTAPTSLSDTPTDYFIKEATLGEFVILCYNRPVKRIPLPEGWQYASWMNSRKAILEGEADLNLPTSTTEQHGGIACSSSDDYPMIFSRENMEIDS